MLSVLELAVAARVVVLAVVLAVVALAWAHFGILGGELAWESKI